MAQTTIDFSSSIVDGIAGGSIGDNRLQVGDFIFTISAQGNWTADFSNGRFNFSEDASFGAENFSITITTASGDLLDFYDYQVSVHGTPVAVGIWPSGVVVDNVNWSDNSLRGVSSAFYRAQFSDPDTIPATSPATTSVISDPDIIDTTSSGTMSFWLDNITFDTAPGPTNVVPSLSATGLNPTFTENGAAVDLFSGVTAATNNAGQTFAAMTLTVSNVSGSDETLTVGGTGIALTNGASGTVSGTGNYAVSLSGGVATITWSGMTLSNNAMSSLIDDMSFSIAGDDPVSASHVVTITSITDSGGTNNVAATSIGSTVGVLPVNDAPAGSATATLTHGAEDIGYVVTAVQLLQGFSDADGDTLSVSGLLASGGATVVDNGDNTYTVTPAANFNGVLTLSYSVSDGHGGSAAASQSVIFDPVNDAPTGSAAATLTHGTEDTAYVVSAAQLLQGFSDIDGDTLSISDLVASDGATVVDNGDDTYTITPAANFNGTVTLTYSATDGRDGSVAASQSVTFDPANDAPTGSATATLANGTEDTAYVVSAAELLQGFSDLDGDTVSVSGLVASDGAIVTDNGDSTYTITPAADFNGAVTLSYSVNDGHGGSAAASQSVTFDPTNDAPTGSATATLTHGDEDTVYVVNAARLLQGFSDLDGDTLSVSGLVASDGAIVTDNGDNTYTITPAANFNGAVTLTYSAIDGHGGRAAASQSLTFDPANDAPTGSALAALAAGTEDTAYVVSAAQLLQGFSDADGDTLSVSGLVASDGAIVTDNGDNTYTITPAANFSGAVTLSYSAIDGHGGRAAASQSVTFDPANDAPTGAASAALASGTEDTAYVVSAAQLLQGFSDADGDTLSVSGLAASDGAIVTDNGDTTYTITPAANFNGAVTLTYSAIDGHGGSAAASQSLTFDPANDAPVAQDDIGTMKEDAAKAFDVLGNDIDIDGPSLGVVNPAVTSLNASVTVNGDGDLVVAYAGDALDAGETAKIVIAYDASDGSAVDGATLTVTVTGVYDPGEDIDGSNKDDMLNGTNKGEHIDGNGGDDTINGRGGDDDISGGVGNDVVRGGRGNDNLHTGDGDDQVFGGAGNDRIVGWGGDDILTGGKGRDLFVFHILDGNDVITDFHADGPDHDTIDLSAVEKFQNFADVKAAMHQENGNTIIDLPGDNSVTLRHVDIDMLVKQDFLF